MSFFALFLLIFGFQVSASIEVPLVRKVAVFPIAGAAGEAAEDAWWQSREVLTKDQRFYVASRRMMVNRGAFQPRRNLKPADAIILGKILDAQALMTFQLDQRTLLMKVFESENGRLFYESKFDFHPVLSVNEQLKKAVNQLSEQFLKNQLFHGFVISNPLFKELIYEIKDKKVITVFKGGFLLEPGDQVRVIKALAQNEGALVSAETRLEVIALGKVLSVAENEAQVELQQISSEEDLKEFSFVLFDKYSKEFGYLEDKESSNLATEYLTSELKDINEVRASHGKTNSSLAWIFNLALLVLLAF
jgi:hypothetical protein